MKSEMEADELRIKLNIIILLKKSFIRTQHYAIAGELREAEKLVIKLLNTHDTDNLLQKVIDGL